MANSTDARKLPCGCTFRTEKNTGAQLRVFVRRGLFCKASTAQETFFARDQAHALDLLETRITCAKGLFHRGASHEQASAGDSDAMQRKRRRICSHHLGQEVEEGQPAAGDHQESKVRENEGFHPMVRSRSAAPHVSALFDALRRPEKQASHHRKSREMLQGEALAPATVTVSNRHADDEARSVGEQQQQCALHDSLGRVEETQVASVDDLCDEQKAAVSQALRGESVFITGAAGTGKSFLLRYLVSKLRFEKGDARVAVTASTGAAAVNIGGCTLHSFAGVGLGLANSDALLQKVLTSPAREGWQMSQVLVIDEISMLDPRLFDALEYIARRVRGNSLPFGGMQLILCGDFLQLPPVLHNIRFCFESQAWEACALRRGTIFLQQVHRQANDVEFIQILHELRKGRCSEDMLARLHKCLTDCKALPADGVLPTKLYCKNVDVDKENQQCLTALEGDLQTYEARDVFRGTAETNSSHRSWLLQTANKAVPEKLQLKEQAQVVLVRNLFGPLVNGTRGVVLSCGQRPVVQFDCGLIKVIEESEFTFYTAGGYMARVQFPLRLGWAITVHKSQGMSLSRAELSLQGAFDFGQVYVALSRVASMAGLWLRTKISQPMVRAHPKVLAYYFA